MTRSRRRGIPRRSGKASGEHDFLYDGTNWSEQIVNVERLSLPILQLSHKLNRFMGIPSNHRFLTREVMAACVVGVRHAESTASPKFHPFAMQ